MKSQCTHHLTRGSPAIPALALLLMTAPAANADLVISEVWPGGLPGDEATSDWIELTNLGDSTINNLDDFHFRDAPVPEGIPDGLPLAGGQLTGVSTLAPGESAVFLTAWNDPLATPDGLVTDPTLAESIEAFERMWGTDDPSFPLGHMLDADGKPGPGLSRSGDQVIIYDGPVTGSTVVDQQSFGESSRASFILNPETGEFGELAEPGRFGAVLGDRPASDGLTDPPIGSPGVIPEPGAGVLLTVLSAGLLLRNRARV